MNRQGQPFFFDENIFDEDAPQKPEEEERAPEPEYTQDQLEAEKQKAFAEGKKAGFQESEAGLTKNIIAVLQKIERDMMILSAAEEDRIATYEQEAVHLCLCAIRKLFPLYAEKYGHDELEHALKNALARHKTPEKLQIEVHESLVDTLQDHIKHAGEKLGKHVTVVGSPALAELECRVIWPDGGIIINRSEIVEKTFNVMKETLAERGVSVHDTGTPLAKPVEEPSEEATAEQQTSTGEENE